MVEKPWSRRVKARLRRLPLFCPAQYREINPDIGLWDPIDHYAERGLAEGRIVARQEAVWACMGRVSRHAPRPEALPEPDEAAALLARAQGLFVSVLVSHAASAASVALGERIVEALTLLNARPELRRWVDGSWIPPGIRIFVAPAEFRIAEAGQHGPDSSLLMASFVADGGTALSGEVSARLGPLLLAQGVIGSDPGLTALAAGAGIPHLLWLPSEPTPEEGEVPQHPLVAGLSRQARRPLPRHDLWANRPIDLVFAGEESLSRGEFLGRNADLLSELECAIVYRRGLWTLPGEEVLDPAAAAHLGRRAKIVLNLHRDEIGFLDPHASILHGIACGALVLSLPCLPHPVLRPGIDYLEDSAKRLPKLIRWLLHTPEGQIRAERVRQEARVRLGRCGSKRRMGLALLRLLLSPPR